MKLINTNVVCRDENKKETKKMKYLFNCTYICHRDTICSVETKHVLSTNELVITSLLHFLQQAFWTDTRRSTVYR